MVSELPLLSALSVQITTTLAEAYSEATQAILEEHSVTTIPTQPHLLEGQTIIKVVEDSLEPAILIHQGQELVEVVSSMLVLRNLIRHFIPILEVAFSATATIMPPKEWVLALSEVASATTREGLVSTSSQLLVADCFLEGMLLQEEACSTMPITIKPRTTPVASSPEVRLTPSS